MPLFPFNSSFPSYTSRFEVEWDGRHPTKTTYEPQQPVYSLLRWKPTILPYTLRRAELYIFTSLHVILGVLENLDIVNIWNGSPINAIVAPVSLLAFFLVFFNSQEREDWKGRGRGGGGGGER